MFVRSRCICNRADMHYATAHLTTDVVTHADDSRAGRVFIARRTNVPWWVLEIRLFWGQKVTRQAQNVCVGLQTESNIAAASYVNYVGLSHLQCSAASAMPATSGFPCVTSGPPPAAGRWVFPAWVFVLLWVPASSSFSVRHFWEKSEKNQRRTATRQT